MNKKVIILVVGFSLIVLTIITMAIYFLHDISNESYDLIDKKTIVLIYFFFAFPVLLEELILLRSLYKLLNMNPCVFAKICYVLSAILIFCALVYQLLVFTRVINQNIFPDEPKAASSRFAELLFLTEWPVIIISFIFGSVPKKAERKVE